MAQQISDLIKLTASGLYVASPADIREALIERFKEIFGSDIDLSTSTADGVFVYDLAVMINNMYDAVASLDNQGKINAASGESLDNLVKLSNIIRRQATSSTASILVTNTSGTAKTENGMSFLDNAGTVWETGETVTFQPGETKTVEVVCETVGKVKAPAGSIKETVQQSSYVVKQPFDSIDGSEAETDSELRIRFQQMQGATSKTVLQGLRSALLSVSGIQDVKIYENNSLVSQTMNDGTNLPAHSVYIIIRKDEGVTVDASAIGNIIHAKMTTGIPTTKMTDGITSGEGKDYEYTDATYGSSLVNTLEHIYWKEAIPVSPQITINISSRDNYTSETNKLISDAVCRYLNSLPIDTAIYDTSGIATVASGAIPKIKGTPVAYVYGVKIGGASSFVTPNTYFKYNSVLVVAGETLTMVLNDRALRYVESMTWADWVSSDYNTVGATISSGNVYVGTNKVKILGTATFVSSSDLVSAANKYTTSTVATGYFYVAQNNYEFEAGQTWNTWVASDYNPFDIGAGRITVEGDKLAVYVLSDKLYLYDQAADDYVKPSDEIVNGETYNTSI